MAIDNNAEQCWPTVVPTALGGAVHAADADAAIGDHRLVGSAPAGLRNCGDPAMNSRPDPAARIVRMDSDTKEWLRAASLRATVRYPGAVGELLSQELLSWMVFGHQLGSDLIMRVADDLLVEEAIRPHDRGAGDVYLP